MTPGAALFLGLVVAQRLAELALARRNTRRLLARGAQEHGAGHYPVMIALHTAWIASIAWFGRDAQLHTAWLAAWVALQAFRAWILLSLRERWTTRIIVAPGRLVRRGPYRVMRHPNYALVVGEIAVTPLVLGLHGVAAVFSLLNAVMLWWRIRAEDAALAPRRSP